MYLDIQFSIAASLLIACLIPLYIYREKILLFKYKDGRLELFLKDVKIHLSKTHPKIAIDYTIVSKTKDEKDMRLRQTLIVEDIIQQFNNYEYVKRTQAAVDKEKLWLNYEEKSYSNPKVPSDWQERRELSWLRDNKCCNRCGTSIKLSETYTVFVKDIEKGGAYNFENIIVLCVDCNKILNNTNNRNILESLILNEKLMVFVQS